MIMSGCCVLFFVVSTEVLVPVRLIWFAWSVFPESDSCWMTSCEHLPLTTYLLTLQLLPSRIQPVPDQVRREIFFNSKMLDTGYKPSKRSQRKNNSHLLFLVTQPVTWKSCCHLGFLLQIYLRKIEKFIIYLSLGVCLRVCLTKGHDTYSHSKPPWLEGSLLPHTPSGDWLLKWRVPWEPVMKPRTGMCCWYMVRTSKSNRLSQLPCRRGRPC